MGCIMLKRRLVVKLIQIQNDNLHLYIYNTEEKFCIFEILHIRLFNDDNIRIAISSIVYCIIDFSVSKIFNHHVCN